MIKGDNIGIGGGWIYEKRDIGNTYITEIGRVDLDVVHSMNTRGLCRIDTCILYDCSGRRIFEDEDLSYAVDYLNEEQMIESVAALYGIKPEQINILEPTFF